MESNLHQGLISPPAPSSPSPTAASGSDDKTGRAPPRLPLPSPSLPVDGTGPPYSPPPPGVDKDNSAKSPAASVPPQVAPSDGVKPSSHADGTLPPLAPSPPPLPVDGTGSSSPSPPALDDAHVTNNLATSFSSPPAASDGDETSRDRTNPPPADTPTSPSRLPVLASSPPPRRRWNLWRRPQELPLRLPVSAPLPPPGRPFNWFHSWKETNRPRAPRLDSVGVEKVIGVFGFSLFGAISLLPSTMDRMKDFSDAYRTFVMMIFGITLAVSTVGVLCGLHGKSDFEQAVCRLTGRLGMMGLALLVLLHVRWALPAGFGYDAAVYGLMVVAALLHFFSWVASLLVGEDRIDDAAPGDAQQQ